jgi:hypothetical protein
MRLNSPRKITLLGGFLLFITVSGSARSTAAELWAAEQASGSMADRASALLVEIQRAAALLWRHADTLESLLATPKSAGKPTPSTWTRSRNISIPSVSTP